MSSTTSRSRAARPPVQHRGAANIPVDDPFRPVVVNDNGAWCWFQGERALVDPDAQLLVVGSIAAAEGCGGAERRGNVELTVVDLAKGTSSIVVLHEAFEADDHNVPALWHRRDGRWLAVYARHKADDFTYWRVSEPGDPYRWGPERIFDWSAHTGGIGVTYSNLVEMGGRLYCFARAVNDDPCALVSDDDGDTWSYAGKLFTRPKVGYVNGYTRYAQGPDRVDLVTTDHHPRDFDNSVYHGYLAGGGLYDSSGGLISPAVPGDAAPSQVELTTVLAAGSLWDGDVISHAWTVDIRHGVDGSIAAVISARANDDPADPDPVRERVRTVHDHRFFYARLAPGGEWRVHQLAQAGPGLLRHEQDYTGLAAIDPYDLDSIYASLPIDPRSGDRLAHHEIFHGRTYDGGASWEWRPLTSDSDVDNLRPIAVPGDPARVPVLWFRGAMTASQHFDCEAMFLDLPRRGVGR